MDGLTSQDAFFEYLKKKYFFLNRFDLFDLIELDERGRIVSITHWNSTLNLLAPYNITGQDIRALFALPDAPLSSFATPLEEERDPFSRLLLKNGFPSNNRYEMAEMNSSLFSAIPLSTLFLKKGEGAGFLGIIHYSALPKWFFSLRPVPALALNREGRIACYNRAFFRYFDSRFSAPSELLGKAAAELMEPEPLQWLTSNPQEFKNDLFADWQTLSNIDFSGHLLEALDTMPGQERLIKKEEGVFWLPGEGEAGLLPIGIPVDLTKHDIMVQAEFELREGDFPLFVINGCGLPSQVFPDYEGYLMGRAREKGFQLKKGGDTIHQTSEPIAPAPGHYTLIAVKRQGRFALHVNTQCVLAFRDAEPFERTSAFQYLYCPKPARLLLKRIRISLCMKTPSDQNPFNELRLRDAKGSMVRFNQVTLESIYFRADAFYYFFLLTDITRLTSRIRTLSDEKESTRQERDLYYNLIMEDKKTAQELIGTSPEIMKVRQMAEVAAATPMTVLLEGATGTGKEVVAHHIHRISPFSRGPFIKVDCGSIPETLLESELFGYEKGAFTGAESRHIGKLEAAQGGTLFLDEISNINRQVQAKLLNFLQDRTVVRLGSARRIQVATRIIAASNVPLRRMVDEGSFRADLFFRLAAFPITLPPLWDRRSDLPLLCAFLLDKYGKLFKKNMKTISASGYDKLMRYRWPGNIRELENVIQKAILLCESDSIEARHLEVDIPPGKEKGRIEGTAFSPGDARALTRKGMQFLLKKNHGILKRAAQEAQVARSTFYRKMKLFELD
ncbi:MAG: sigma-54 dependent transcriptional regulator [Fibrobacterota bacterium]